MTPAEPAALERLIQHAQSDTGQSRRVAHFPLPWPNAGQCVGFDLTNLWDVDDTIAEDMSIVFRLITRANRNPGTLGYGPQFEAIVRAWRPELLNENH